MAYGGTTPYKDTGAFLVASGTTFRMDGAVNADSMTRTNNTVNVAGANGVYKVTGPSSYYFSGFDVTVAYQFPSGTTRRTQSLGSGTRTVGDVLYSAENNFSFSVGADDTSVNVRAGAAYDGDSVTYSSTSSFTIPPLGAPAVSDTVNSVTENAIKVTPNVTDWGTNATAGSVRSYIADNSGFTGQTYIATTDNVAVTHTGLIANKQYWFRGWCSNGGGKTDYSSAVTGVTLATTSETSKIVQATSADFVLATVQGQYATSTKIQYRVVGTTTWTDSTASTSATPSITISGLLPSTDYEYQLVVTTTAGVWTSAISSLSSKSAVKMILPDGTVKDGVPYVILPDGTMKMVQITGILP